MALTFALKPGVHRRSFLRGFPRSFDAAGLGPSLPSTGFLEARLASSAKDVRRVQRLRYRVFYEEAGVTPDTAARLTRRDVCRFDRVSDHLIVVDRSERHRDGAPRVVGVYRLLRQEVAERNFGFYSAREFDVASLVARRRDLRFLEVGRACVAASHRRGHVLELLWRALWAYARHHGVDALFGCASLPGADASRHAAAIRSLSSGDPSLRVSPRSGRMDAQRAVEAAEPADPRSLVRILPPLVKGYWRLGATFSPTPVVDRAFNTTDVFVVMPLAEIEARYLQYFGVVEPCAADGARPGRVGIPMSLEFG